jgi:hypothetical protein
MKGTGIFAKRGDQRAGRAQCARSLAPRRETQKESAMAKGQKKSNKEIRKPKKAKASPAVAPPSYLNVPGKKK